MTLTQSEFEGLSESLQKEYALQTDGTHKLDLGPDVFTTDKDPSALFTALQAERDEVKKLKGIADKLEAEKKSTELSKLTDIEEVKAHFQQQLDERDKAAKREAEARKAELVQQREGVAKQQASAKALEVASELFGTKAAIFLPHIERMLKGSVDSAGNPVLEILDPTTNLPNIDQNFENFKQSVSTNPLFKDSVVVSNASGGSANDSNSSSGTTRNDGSAKGYKDYTPAELLAIKREDPARFSNLKAQLTS